MQYWIENDLFDCLDNQNIQEHNQLVVISFFI